MNTTKTSAKISLPVLLCALAACSPAEETQTESTLGQAGMSLRSDILADTDVAGMSYTITPVDCGTGIANDPEGVVTTVRDLEDILLPGGHPGLEGAPLDADSTHLFADAFQALPAGCYDVNAQPIDADGNPSADCAAADAQSVGVIDEKVTELTLIVQCDSDNTLGGLDVIAAINHEPILVDAYYPQSKFTCQNTTTVCVVAEDADNDPLALVATGGEGVEISPMAPEKNDAGQWVFCAEIKVPDVGEYPISLTVYDQLHAADGSLVNVETVLGEGVTSNATLTLPVHSMDQEACICECAEGFELNAAGDACERFQEADAVFNGAELTVCQGDDLSQYGAQGAQFPDGLAVRNEFFGHNRIDRHGRLNAVGIWSCEANAGQWIGFSACVTVERDGEYVVGSGGDDFVQVYVDGQLLLNKAGVPAYEIWWMTPVSLTAGTHVIEMKGRSPQGQDTLGAEIYGPFPVGSTANDQTMAALDYENNIIWSTADQLGGTFDTGTSTGYTCPAGTSLNLCGDAPTCTGYERSACAE